MDVRATSFDLGSIVSAQCDMIRPMAEKKKIDLTIVVSDEIPKVEQDQSKLQQILFNLLSNAVKFTPEGGQISVAGKLLDAESFLLEVLHKSTHGPIFSLQTYSVFVPISFYGHVHVGTEYGWSVNINIHTVCDLN